MPGLRFVSRLDMGTAFGDEWRAAHGRPRAADNDEATESLLDAATGLSREELQAAFPDIDVGSLSGRDLAVLRVLKVVDEFRLDSNWNGTSYRSVAHVIIPYDTERTPACSRSAQVPLM
jgi:hypothetical protein